MSGKIRPSLREKILKNVAWCNLSQTDKNCIKQVFDKFEEQQAEIERLKKLTDAYFKLGIAMTRELETAKAEAVKEFAEKVKEKVWDVPYKTKEAHYVQVVDIGDIEDIEKEMVGDLTMNKLNDKEVLKDFVKRLKEKSYTPKPYGSGKVVDECDIDNLLKEMVGDDKK